MRRSSPAFAAPLAVPALPAASATAAISSRPRMSASGGGPIGIAVAGAGRIGQVHSATISSMPNARLVAIADPFEEFGRKAADAYNTEWTANFDDLLTNPDVQGIVIGSPTPFHADQIKAAAAAGKDIFCEKPISNDLKVIDECLAAVDKAGVRLIVGFQRRFDANFMRVKAEIEAGNIGGVRMFHIVSRDPAPPPAEYLAKSGGLFLDQTSHDFDQARFVTGSEIDEVYVTAAAFEGAAQEAGDVDTAITVLKMKDGSFGTIDNSRRCSYGYDQRIEVFGEGGMVTGENRSPDTVVVSGKDGITAGLPYSFFMDRYAGGYQGIMEEFVGMIEDGRAATVTGADGRAPIVAGMAAAKSLKEGRPVKLSEVDI